MALERSPSRMTQRSQRIPLTWIVSSWSHVLRVPSAREVGAHCGEAVALADRKLARGLVLEPAERLEEGVARRARAPPG